MDATLFGVGISGILAGILIGLKIIAPRTKTKIDDRALEIAEVVVPVLTANQPAKPAPTPVRPKSRDHRAPR